MRTLARSSVLVLGLAHAASASEPPRAFPSEAFARLELGELKERLRFRWPAIERFRDTWAGEGAVIRVAEADVEGGERERAERVLLGLWPKGEAGLEVFVMGAATREGFDRARSFVYGTGKVVRGALGPGGEGATPDALELELGGRRLVLKLHYLSPVAKPADSAWASWSYAATLLASDPPVDEEFTPPMGQCSMDTGPQRAAADYADKCYEAGRLGCFLQLQVRIMGDRFDRVAWSSYGERSHGTEVGRLERAGVDPVRFLRGLVFQFATERSREELWPWRLSRALAESPRAARFAKELAEIASDPTVDEYNRLRATMTLAFHRIREQGEHPDRAAIKKELSALPLSVVAKKYLASDALD